MITVFSNRVYKKRIGRSAEIEIEQETYKYNRAKWYLVKLLTREHNGIFCFLKDFSLHMLVKMKFGFSDYFANSVIIDAKAAWSSRVELHKLEIAELRDRITVKKKKVEKLRKELKGMRAMLISCIRISKASKLKKPPKKDLKLKTYRGCKER
ncbi:MAG TPA: hypothetical protein VMW83_11190 [Spirochaetia bacterium]|nr:hypothetical protein [Spirochaetia bacterium]